MDFDLYLRFVVALVFVLALIGVAAWLLRRFGLAGRLAASVGKQRRLRIVEVAPLDGKHRLVLMRRDEVEHLLLIGAGADLVIETGIRRPPAAEAEAGA